MAGEQKMRGLSIRSKLTIYGVGLVLVTAGVLGHAGFVFARRTLHQQIEERLRAVAAGRRDRLLAYVHEQQHRLALVASRTRLQQVLAEQQAGTIAAESFRQQTQLIVHEVLAGSTGVEAVWITDATGRVVAAGEPDQVARSRADDAAFQHGQQGTFFGAVETATQPPRQLIAGPVTDRAGRVLGVVILRADASELLAILADPAGLGATGEAVVGEPRDGQYRSLVPLRYPTPGETPPQQLPGLQGSRADAVDGRGFLEVADYRGVPVLAAHLPVGYGGWELVTKLDAAEAYGPVRELWAGLIILELLMLAAGVLVSYELARRLTEPLRRLAQLAGEIAGGQWHVRVAVASRDELGALGDAFNRMSEELAHVYANLEDRVRERTAALARTNEALQAEAAERQRAEQIVTRERDLIQALMDNIPDNIYFKDRDSRFVRVNRSMARWFGLEDPDAAIGKTDFQFFSREHARQAFEDEQRVIRTGQPLVGKEEKETWPDGRETWVSTTKVPWRAKSGEVLGTFGMSRDITDRKQSQKELARFAVALNQKNRQLEEDLRTAQEIQQALMPTAFPTFPPEAAPEQSVLRFAYRYEATATLGGDFIELLPRTQAQAGVILCDVMGHGTRAALVGALLRGLIAEHAWVAGDPGRLLTAVNRALLAHLKDVSNVTFASALCVVVDAASGELVAASAGHPNPLWLRRQAGRVEPMQIARPARGPVLGLMGDATYLSGRWQLAAGDAVLLFTDGLYEVEGVNGENFGLERLQSAAELRLEAPLEHLVDEVRETARGFSRTAHFGDDVCLLAVEWQPVATARRAASPASASQARDAGH